MKPLHFLAIAFTALLAASCSSKPEISYLPAKADGDSNWGLVDANGEFLFTDEFEERPSAVVNGYFFVEENKGLSVYKAEKTPKLVGDLTGLRDCGYYTEGLIPVTRKGEHITFVDNKGNTKFALDKVDGVNVRSVLPMFINGLCSFRTEENRWGAIDKDGKVVIKPLYEQPLVFVEDRVLVRNMDTEKIVIIDRNGNVKQTVSDLPETTDIKEPEFIDGLTMVRARDGSGDARWYCVNDKGDVNKLPTSIDYIYEWNKDYIIFESDDKSGLMTIEGETVVRPKYDGMCFLANGDIIGRRNDKIYKINKDGEGESLGQNIAPAVRNPYFVSKLFDFKFEMLLDSDNTYRLCNYDGEKVGKDMEAFKDKIYLGEVKTDFFDYDAVVADYMSMFDTYGLKEYPFLSQMSAYAEKSGHDVQWFRGDTSMAAPIDNSSNYFNVSTSTIYSNNSIVYNAGGWESYDWQYNPDARVNAFKVIVEFPSDDHCDEIMHRIAEALQKRYNVSVSEGSYGMNSIRHEGYGYIELEVNAVGWLGEEVAAPAEEAAAPADTVCDAVEGEVVAEVAEVAEACMPE